MGLLLTKRDAAVKRILVTGGAGFIGSNFVRRAIRDGFCVLNLDALTYAGNLSSLKEVEAHANYRFVQGDIGDPELVSALLRDFRPDAIVNMAAESHVDRSIDGPAAFLQTNVLATQILLDCALKYWSEGAEVSDEGFCFLHVSTDEVYGDIEIGFFTEESPYAPNSPYAASKAASDHIVRAYNKTYGLPVIVTNCTNNYGPFQYPEKLIPLAILKALSGQKIPVYGTGENIRDWIFVEDHCEALFKTLENGKIGETYLIGAQNERRNIDVVEAICSELDRLKPSNRGTSYSSQISFVDDRPGHDARYAVSAGKAMRELSWHPQTNFESALRTTISWYLMNEDWISSALDKKYHGERLGLKKNV